MFGIGILFFWVMGLVVTILNIKKQIPKRSLTPNQTHNYVFRPPFRHGTVVDKGGCST